MPGPLGPSVDRSVTHSSLSARPSARQSRHPHAVAPAQSISSLHVCMIARKAPDQLKVSSPPQPGDLRSSVLLRRAPHDCDMALLRAFLQRWRVACISRRLVVIRTTRALISAWTCWRGWARVARRRTVRVARAASTMGRRQLRRCWDRWCAQTALLRLARPLWQRTTRRALVSYSRTALIYDLQLSFSIYIFHLVKPIARVFSLSPLKTIGVSIASHIAGHSL